MRRVLDTSALLSGRQFPGELLTVPEVLGELSRQGVTPQLEAILETQVRVASAGRPARARALAAAESTGDAHRLSPTDLALVALALEEEAVLVTDDYSIQNVGKALGIPFEPVMERGIREQWRWSYRCSGCGKVWPEWHDDCPTCGAVLRTARPGISQGRGSGRGR
ncbi:MAG: hypothetical protein A3K59_06675 [Euryarchaeota archaeon RBG_19FT_COMBO_69_17]|nr:MAG: hypothetical protein A3K59_06675 [Euryarchaeota archaeon RBG_19FT_COMBO_69_17]